MFPSPFLTPFFKSQTISGILFFQITQRKKKKIKTEIKEEFFQAVIFTRLEIVLQHVHVALIYYLLIFGRCILHRRRSGRGEEMMEWCRGSGPVEPEASQEGVHCGI